MKPRVITTVVTVAVALVLVIVATKFQSGAAGWAHEHAVNHVLWTVDVIAVVIIALGQYWSWILSHMERIRSKQLAQLDTMLAHSQELDQVNADLEQKNDEYGERIAELTAAVASLREAGETRLQVVGEQALAALQERVIENLRQMEAVNLALQYHRAEIKLLRQEMDDVREGMAAIGAPLAPPRFAPGSRTAEAELGADPIVRTLPSYAAAELAVQQAPDADVPSFVGPADVWPTGTSAQVETDDNSEPAALEAQVTGARAEAAASDLESASASTGQAESGLVGTQRTGNDPTVTGLDLDKLLAELAAAASATLVARQAAGASSGAVPAPPEVAESALEPEPAASPAPEEGATSTLAAASVEPQAEAADARSEPVEVKAPPEQGAVDTRTRRLPIALFHLKR